MYLPKIWTSCGDWGDFLDWKPKYNNGDKNTNIIFITLNIIEEFIQYILYTA